MTTNFTASDVASLEAKLLELELAEGEREALNTLVDCAEQATDEVSGFRTAGGLTVGGLNFLTHMDGRPESLLDDGGTFASAGGLGSTWVNKSYLGGALGDE